MQVVSCKLANKFDRVVLGNSSVEMGSPLLFTDEGFKLDLLFSGTKRHGEQ